MNFGSFFRGAKNGMCEAGLCSAAVVNSLLLLVVYVVAVGVTALVARTAGKRFLESPNSSGRKNRKTYWSDLNLTTKPLKEYYHQF